MAKFEKGKSGNPGGRPKTVKQLGFEIQNASAALSLRAIEILGEVMEDKEATAASRISAASCILERAIGKPSEGLPPRSGETPPRSRKEVADGLQKQIDNLIGMNSPIARNHAEELATRMLALYAQEEPNKTQHSRT